MAGKRISELNELSQADDNDVIAIVDTGASETKKIKKAGVVGIITPIDATSDTTITSSYFGKSVRADTLINITMTYDTLTADHNGALVEFINKDEGKLTIQAPVGISIMDSSDGGTIYNNGGEDASLILEYVHDLSKLIVIGGHGTWTTTS